MDESHLARFLAVALIAATVAGVAFVAATGTVAADQHEPENAPTYETFDGGVNFTINLPHRTDHYPGTHPVHGGSNGYNASIEYFAAGEAAFTEQDAEEGLWLDFIEVKADWIDYSECDATRNTKVFGIDRGNTNSGTQVDEDLIEHRRSSHLSAGGLTVTFFDWGDLSGDPPYVSPDDAVIAAQGAGSNDGPCLKMTDEPGWYQVQAYTNGTIANECTEEGNPDCEPDDKEWRGLNLNSNYVYICECDSEQEARETLGPPPNEEDSSDDGGSTPTPTQAPDDTATATPAPDDTPTATPAPDDTPTATPAPDDQGSDQQGGGGNDQSTAQQGGGGNDQSTAQRTDDQASGQDQESDRSTPTIGEGPGFTPVAALVALLAAALLGYRRD